MILTLLVFTVAFASWIAAVMVSAVAGLVSLKDGHWLRGAALLLLAVVLFAAGGTYLYQLGEVPS